MVKLKPASSRSQVNCALYHGANAPSLSLRAQIAMLVGYQKSGKFEQLAKFRQRPWILYFWNICIKVKLTKQTVKILMKRLLLSRLIWIVTVCKRMSEFIRCPKLPDLTLSYVVVFKLHSTPYGLDEEEKKKKYCLYHADNHIWAMTCDFQQCGVLTNVDSDEPVKPPFRLRNSKWCSVSSFTVIKYSSD